MLQVLQQTLQAAAPAIQQNRSNRHVVETNKSLQYSIASRSIQFATMQG